MLYRCVDSVNIPTSIASVYPEMRGREATALERAEAIPRTMNNNGAAIAAMRLAEDHSQS